ncbi:MAG: stalk domain-containing protein [Armatimonadota bacterium]
MPWFVPTSGQVRENAWLAPSAPNRLVLQLRGILPAAVEVEIDGVIVAHRQLSSSTGSLQIPLLSTGLPPGFHEATVRLYDSRGRLIRTLRGTIELLPDPTAPIVILTPRHGTRVAGTVPIEVRVDSASRPYVSFLIDGQVRTLRNYPPYVYHWDTTQERNGWHTIEVWSFDGHQTFKSPVTRVFVNNPGGRTERVAPTPPAKAAEMNAPRAAAPSGETARSTSAPRLSAEGKTPAESLNRPAVSPPPEPHLSAGREMRLALSNRPEPRHLQAAPVIAESRSVPPGAPRIELPAASPRRTTTREPHRQTDSHHARFAVSMVLPFAEGNLRSSEVLPRMRGQKLDTPQVQLAVAPAASPARPTVKATWHPITFGTRLPAGITHFEVLLDTRRVSFDVAPRVQNGIPLVAIRHVFEQAGGELRWDNQRKVATVVLDEQVITFDVRGNRVQLNGRVIPTDAPLQIVNGRVMVSAVLFAKALNAHVAFDPVNRHLHIVRNRATRKADE